GVGFLYHQLYNERSQAIGLHLKKIMSRVVSATPEGLYFSHYLQNVVDCKTMNEHVIPFSVAQRIVIKCLSIQDVRISETLTCI
ncbi:hypothetical protein NQ318_023086, partial [Aromia moschata]